MGPFIRRFDWEKRYDHDAWRVTDDAQARRFIEALGWTECPRPFRSNEANGSVIFWWDHHLSTEDNQTVATALSVAVNERP